jgi:CheY-like chemotaxis protein
MPDKTILIVDDTPANIAAALAILKDQYRTKVATSGIKALEQAGAADKPDLILLDVTMPEMDGYEVCSRLKADPDTAEIPVVFLTARTEAEDEAKGVRARRGGSTSRSTRPSCARVCTPTCCCAIH